MKLAALRQHIPKPPTQSALLGKSERDLKVNIKGNIVGAPLGAILFHQCSTTQKGMKVKIGAATFAWCVWDIRFR